MKISIALATYNGERFLREQLESLAAQQRLPDELVVCDDHSTDGTWEILEQFAAAAPFPVKLHRNPDNVGYVANFGRALSLTDGDLVFLADQDDVWIPEKLSVFEKSAEATPLAMAFVCDTLLCDAELNPGVKKSENLLRQGGRAEDNVAGACTALRREFLAIALPMPESGYSHDGWIHHLARALDRRAYIDEPLQYWRRHGSNASQTPNSVLHGLSPAFRLRYILDSALRDPVPHWLERSRQIDGLRERLVERHVELVDLVGKASATSAIEAIETEIEAIGARAAILRTGRTGRFRKVLSYYRRGGYATHRGLASAIKDLVRPRSRAELS